METEYKCFNCGNDRDSKGQPIKELFSKSGRRVRLCDKCGGRVWMIKRKPIPKRVKAR